MLARASLSVSVAWVSLALFAHAADANEPDWTLVRERSGVSLYETTASDGTALQSRATTLIDASVLEVLALLHDDARLTEWMARCVEGRTLEKRSRWNRLSYTRFALWPFSDRDVVVETKITLDAGATSADVRMLNVESDLQAPPRGVVRMPTMRGIFHLEQSDLRTRIDFTLSIELGGRAPPRLARYTRQRIPMESLENLRELVPSSRSQYAERVRSWQSELSQ